MDQNTARLNMVQQQLKTWEVLDPRILDLFKTLPRELFVLPAYQTVAFSDTFLPIGYDQVTLPPKMAGRILQAIQLDPQETVLEIGTGTGYMTALIAGLAKEVISFEIIPELSQKAAEILRNLHYTTIQLNVGNGISYISEQNQSSEFGPFDAIILTGSLLYLPRGFREQLSLNGRLFAILGEVPLMSAKLITRLGKERWSEHTLFETVVPPLNAPQPKGFRF